MKQRCIEERIDGVLSGVHEFNLRKMAALSEMLELPCYCTEAQQDLCDDKPRFKEACREAGLAVSGEYTEAEAYDLPLSAYPLAVKPRDGSGSRGFTKCETPEELAEAISFAKEHSFCGEALIEEFVDSDALIVQYTAHEGNIYFCGLTDKLRGRWERKVRRSCRFRLRPLFTPRNTSILQMRRCDACLRRSA